MFITYSPGKGDRQTWDFDPGEVRASMAEMIEKRYGKPFEQWFNDVRVGSMKARRVLLWHLICRTGHALPYDDTPDFLAKEVTVEQSVSEIEVLLESVGKMKLTDEERNQAESQLSIAMVEAREREQAAAERAELAEPVSMGKAG